MALNGLFCADVPLRNYSLTSNFSRARGNLPPTLHLDGTGCVNLRVN